MKSTDLHFNKIQLHILRLRLWRIEHNKIKLAKIVLPLFGAARASLILILVSIKISVPLF